MFTKLGFFRFVKDYDQPVHSLRSALRKCGDVAGSLIVLPEGFNIGRTYYQEGFNIGRTNLPTVVGRRDPCVLRCLQDLAEDCGTTFVAGLIIDPPDAPSVPAKPFCSSYLIDGAHPPVLLCRKMGDDKSRNYTRCEEHYDVKNPHRYGDDVFIASLLCLDLTDETPAIQERRKRLRTALAAASCPQRILCVPANMGSQNGAPEIAKSWPGAYFILANSLRSQCRSLIAKGEVTLLVDDWGDDNAVRLHTLVRES